MAIRVITFGPIRDLTNNESICFDQVADTDQLVRKLHIKYPALEHSPYLIAVDQEIISGNFALSDSDHEIALLPPYSGG
ncbi:MAG: molybdopterin synthase sulfur carrier subunit [Bacteroidetes bacterium]|nr:MAG: molybdopterin synthase sulfur carrier subunit [Bacteroidota bacterium]